jgi:predicted ribosome quality control (RQC) complex YloA/Tae2 family protein
MKAKFIFDMSDSEDAQKFERVCQADSMASVIWEFLRNSRKTIGQKIESQEGEIDVFEAVDMCFERFGELLKENSVSIDKIWSCYYELH